MFLKIISYKVIIQEMLLGCNTKTDTNDEKRGESTKKTSRKLRLTLYQKW